MLTPVRKHVRRMRRNLADKARELRRHVRRLRRNLKDARRSGATGCGVSLSLLVAFLKVVSQAGS